jgi:hypothetical protein
MGPTIGIGSSESVQLESVQPKSVQPESVYPMTGVMAWWYGEEISDIKILPL